MLDARNWKLDLEARGWRLEQKDFSNFKLLTSKSNFEHPVSSINPPDC